MQAVIASFDLTWQFLGRIITPESLAVQRKVYGGDWRLQERAQCLKPGDLIMVRTPGKFYEIFRGLANGHEYDHLAIVLEHGLVLHIGPPDLRLLPVELLLSPRKQPKVFRPTLSDVERKNLISSLLELVGKRYNTIRTYSFIARMAFRKLTHWGVAFSTTHPTENVGKKDEVMICTDAILGRLLVVSEEWKRTLTGENLPTDFKHIGSWSIHDILEISSRFPSLLVEVELPPVQQPLNEAVLRPVPISSEIKHVVTRVVGKMDSALSRMIGEESLVKTLWEMWNDVSDYSGIHSATPAILLVNMMILGMYLKFRTQSKPSLALPAKL